MRPRWFLAGIGVAGAALIAVATLEPSERAETPLAGDDSGRTALASLLAADAGFAASGGPWTYQFPRDHVAHPEFRSEWWTLTGSFDDPGGRAYAFTLGILRIGLAPGVPARESAWATGQVYRGQMTLVEVDAGRFHAGERLSRGALGLAGALDDRVWVEGWMLTVLGPDRLRLAGALDGLSLDLELSGTAPAITATTLAEQAGDAETTGPFHFYLMTGLSARGELRAGGEPVSVVGTARLDRAWGEVPLGVGPVALDRFAVRLDDGRDLLLLQTRRRDGRGRVVTSGLLVDGGAVRPLDAEAVTVEALAAWRSPRSGGEYPARWRLRVPAVGLDIELEPVIADQEVVASLVYWSGAVRASGLASGAPVEGRGQVDLTGYAPGDAS